MDLIQDVGLYYLSQIIRGPDSKMSRKKTWLGYFQQRMPARCNTGCWGIVTKEGTGRFFNNTKIREYFGLFAYLL